jgi:ribosomal protein S12 methylthiotransferase accessory factor
MADVAPVHWHVTSPDLALARDFAAQLGSTGIGVSIGSDELPTGASIVIGLFDATQRMVQLHWQASHAEVPAILRVEIEPDSVCIGPVIVAGEGSCIECLLNWTRSEWSELNRKLSNNGGGKTASNVLPQVLPALIEEFLAQGATPGRVAVHNRTSGETVVRRFIPHPFCSRCRAFMSQVREISARDLATPILVKPGTFRAGGLPNHAALVARFMDQRTGLVRYLFDEPSSTVMPMAVASFLQDGSLDQFENGYGRAVTGRASQIVAMLEALERFAGYMPRARREILRGSFRELGERAADPADFILHAPEQRGEPAFNLVDYTPDLEMNWLSGWSMRRRAEVLIPEQLVYYRLPDPPGRPTNRFVYEVSSGCAMGSSPIEAALHGLFEVIERDGFLNCWYARRPPVQLDASDADNSAIRALIARSEAAGYEVHLFDVESSFGVTVIWGLIVNPADDAPVKSYSAAGASIDPEAAILSALVEVCTSISVYEGKLPQKRSQAEEMLRDSAKVQTMEDHVLLYSHPDSFGRLTYLFSRPGRVPLKRRFASWYRDRSGDDLAAIFTGLCDRVLADARDVLIVNQSFGEMEAAGFNCVKVLAPGLTPVSFGHQHRRISLERIRRYAGPAFAPATEADINPYPHNFP